jgi:hypothetical protein
MALLILLKFAQHKALKNTARCTELLINVMSEPSNRPKA